MTDSLTLFDTIPPGRHAPPRAREACPTCAGTGLAPDTLHGPGLLADDAKPTSAKAARSPLNAIRFGSQRHAVLAALRDFGPSTAARIALRLSTPERPMSRNQTAARLLECRESGWVEYQLDDDGEPVEARTSEDASGFVQQLTRSGRDVLASLEREG